MEVSENPSKGIIPLPGATERKIKQIITLLEQNAVRVDGWEELTAHRNYEGKLLGMVSD